MENQMPVIPTEYRAVILQSVEEQWDRTKDLLHYYLGVQWQLPSPCTQELLATPLGQMLAEIARCAAGKRYTVEELEGVDETIEIIKRVLFVPAGLNTYEIPDIFWTTPLGEMMALAILRVKGDQLITISQAAKMYRMKTEAMSAKVRVRRLHKYFNPKAPQNQGRWLVDKAEVKRLWE